MLTTDELLKIQVLPEFLRTDHCYNDLQHAMLVILFRHGLTALKDGNIRYANRVLDNASLYLYIHFLNEEEGMAFKMQQGWIARDALSEHSEMHVRFLDFWKNEVLLPHKTGEAAREETAGALARFYNLLIKHIDKTDIAHYGPDAIEVERTRHEMARIARSNMPMSPFMAGAYETVKILAPDVALALDTKHLNPIAVSAMKSLNLVPDVGRILNGATGSLRDRFAQTTRGDLNGTPCTPATYAA